MKTRKEFSKMNKGKRNIQNVIILPHINNGEVESLVEYSLKYQVRIKSYNFLKIIFKWHGIIEIHFKTRI